MSRTNNPNSKAKRSYSLSRGSVEFLEKLRKKHRARSVSAVLEELVLAYLHDPGATALPGPEFATAEQR